MRPDVQGTDVRTDVPNPQDVQENDVPDQPDSMPPADVTDPDATTADVMDPDVPMMCPMGQMLCGTMCVDTNTSAANCGTCGRSCGPGQTCAGGMCQGMVMCGMGETACGMACANLQTDPMNCGSCGGACMAGEVCTMGRCGPPRMMCPMGQTDCTPMAAMPTCVDTQTSDMNCGACGTACMAGTTCVAGACTCAAGTTLCGRACVNTQTDGMNCGGCGTVCPMGQVCTMGTCGCPTGQTLCGGVCVNTQTDNANCGTCGTACAGGTTCTTGTCSCPMGQTACGTPAMCVNTQTSNANCGACGRTCAMGQTCTAGACACPAGTTLCGAGAMAACVNTQTSSTNCGACGMVCAMGTSCMAGRCMGTPPANDTRAGATVINLAMPSQTLMADTTAARNNTTACACTNGNDVFYTFTITQPEIIYADTFGATWDTSLFIQDAAGANVTATPGFVTCNDDHAAAGFCNVGASGLQSQIVARLNPGMYFLVLSGCGAGTAGIHFQHAPAGNGTSTRIAPDATTRTAMSTTAGTGTATGACCSTGADNSLFWVTCPNTAAASLNANTCNTATGVTTAAYNVSLSQNTPARGAVVCNDDITGVCGNGSSVVAAIPATTATTANINTIVVDGCAASGAATVNFTLAPACAGTQTRCNAACVDTQTDANNCGACSRRCAVGNRCIAGACVAPPAGDLPTAPRVINMAQPQTIVTGIDTRAAVNNTAGACGCTSGQDVFFTFTIAAGQSEIIYADTLGSSYDTSLFLQTAAGTNITATNLPANGSACNDDGGLAGCGTGLQSQIMARLDAGNYRLVLSGCGAGGTANVRFQHAPVGADVTATGLRFLAAGASTPGGTVAAAPVGRVNLGCNAGGQEHTFYWYTCGAATGGNFTASTCGRATWDTSLVQYSPGRTAPGAGVCNDDACSLQSSMTSAIPAGPGLHTFYVDTFTARVPGAYTVSISRP